MLSKYYIVSVKSSKSLLSQRFSLYYSYHHLILQNDYTALMVATLNGHIAMVPLLVRRGANVMITTTVNIQTLNIGYDLFVAELTNYERLLHTKILYPRYCSCVIVSQIGVTAISIAENEGLVEILAILRPSHGLVIRLACKFVTLLSYSDAFVICLQRDRWRLRDYME